MKAYYDFHIHSCLSPCADDDMTPLSIVSMASVKGLNAIAISDHNAIDNIEVAQKYGKLLNIIVVPAIELQTNEDIHLLALFKKYEQLKDFYQTLDFQYIENKEEIFGRQLIIDEDDKIKGTVKRLLVTSSNESIYQLSEKIKAYGGAVYLAHIDREANGILNTLGEIPSDLFFDGIEFTREPSSSDKIKYNQSKIIYNSDAHNIYSIKDKSNYLEVENLTLEAIFNALKK